MCGSSFDFTYKKNNCSLAISCQIANFLRSEMNTTYKYKFYVTGDENQNHTWDIQNQNVFCLPYVDQNKVYIVGTTHTEISDVPLVKKNYTVPSVKYIHTIMKRSKCFIQVKIEIWYGDRLHSSETKKAKISNFGDGAKNEYTKHSPPAEYFE